MNTELIIVLAVRPDRRLEIVGHYETELDDQPGLEHVMTRATKDNPKRKYFALRIDPDRATELCEVIAAPAFGPLVAAVASHPTDDGKPKHAPHGLARRQARNRAGQRRGIGGPCWGCDNNSTNPEQHASDCPKGNGW